jgi:hypothetical protein
MVIGMIVTFVVFILLAPAYRNHSSNDFSSYDGPVFIIYILTILLNLAFSFSALIGAFVLAIQRKQMGWLAGLIVLTLIGIVLSVADPLELLTWELLCMPVLASFALFGKRREMV